MSDDAITVTVPLGGWSVAITAPYGVRNIFFIDRLELDITQQNDRGEFGRIRFDFPLRDTEEDDTQ